MSSTASNQASGCLKASVTRGSLQVRGTTLGGRLYLRTGAARSRFPLGAAKGQNLLTLDQARQRAWKMPAEHHRAAPERHLGNLLTAYCETLAQTGRASHKSTLGLFHRHLRDSQPQLWMQSARTVSAQQIVEVLNRLVAEDKLPTARKLRASLTAAFNRALRAELCVQSPAMRGFGMKNNPVAPTAPIPCGKSSERVLTIGELRALWNALSEMDSPSGVENHGICRVGHAGVGILIQSPAADGTAGAYPAGRS